MIHRFYVNNYRCLDNFELPIEGLSSALLLGKNGAGKSTVGRALQVLQQIGRGVNRVGKLVGERDVSFGRTDVPVRFELSVKLGEWHFEYTLALELPPHFREMRVLEESLTISGDVKFSRQVAELRFPRSGSGQEATMPVDWHLVGLPLVQARSDRDPVHVFQQWLGRMVILQPDPAMISGDSGDESLFPERDLSNLGDWWSGILNHSPAAYAKIDKALRQVMPDLLDIKNPLVAKESRSLIVQFGDASRPQPIPFELLSDGEKCLVAWAMVMAANEAYGPLFCFWDEIDCHLALSEIGDFTGDLRRAFERGGQFVATSHNVEAIHRFSDNNTFVLHRRSHLEPTQVRPLSSFEYTDLAGALARGELTTEVP